MIIDEEAFNNSDFTLMSNEELTSYNNDKEVLRILKKYQIIKKTNHLTDSAESHYLTLINHIDDLYYLNKPLPADIKELIQKNTTYKQHLLTNVKKRLDNLMTNGSALFFKEIVAIINLLSLGEKFNIFLTYNHYDFNEVGNLFRSYEENLREQFVNDKENFEAVFDCYTTLIHSYNQLCMINSTDLQRKKTINPIIDLITESINMLKFTVSLEEAQLNRLNNVLGEILYYFAHLPYIESKDKELYYLIDEFYLLLEKQTDGYNLSKDTDFGGDLNNQSKQFLIFINNSGYLLLTMLQKLKYAFADKDYFNTRSFKKCMKLFSANFPNMHINEDEETLESFRNKLLFALVQNYILSESSIGTITSHKSAIDDFIQSADKFDIHNIETIHDVLLFADDIEDYKYLHIGETLIGSKLLQNDYYEFFKLKTIDIVINYFIHNKTKENILPFINSVIQYIEHNKKGSHLLSVFSKLYLSIAHYYSTLSDEDSVNKAKDLYAIFINMNGLELLSNEYGRINRQILTALGKYYAKELQLKEENLTADMIIDLGKKLSKNYLEYKELELKYQINNNIANITSEIIEEEMVNYEQINRKISDIIANQIFYGLCVVRVKGLTKEQSSIVDNGYKLYSIAMMNDYVLQFIFPAVYEDAFKNILTKNKLFIKKNVTNILASFSKNSFMYIDKTTGFENAQKLELDLQATKDKNITFIEVLIGSFSQMNSEFGFEIGQKFLRSIAHKIKSILEANDYIYYLGDGRMGIVLGYGSDFNAITKKIANFKIRKENKEIDMKLHIAVTQAHASTVLKDSEKLLNEALVNNKELLFNIG